MPLTVNGMIATPRPGRYVRFGSFADMPNWSNHVRLRVRSGRTRGNARMSAIDPWRTYVDSYKARIPAAGALELVSAARAIYSELRGSRSRGCPCDTHRL